jgi:hypothetical protein
MLGHTESFAERIFVQNLNAEDALSAAKFPASASFIDTQPYKRFGFIILAGALNTATVAQVVQDTSATQTAGVKSVTGATLTVPTDGDDEAYIIEVDAHALDSANDFRYVSLDISGATGGDDYGAIMFFGIADKAPVTQQNAVAVVTG